jgi:hypothetical protein
MPQTCSICQHPEVESINAALLKGDSLWEVAGKFPPLTKSSLSRHREHLPVQALEAAGRDKTVKLVSLVDTVIQDFTRVRKRFVVIANKASRVGDLDAEISAMREVRMTMTDTLKAKGMWAPAVTNAIQVNVNNAPSITTCPEWSTVIRIIDRHPEVKAELVEALQGIRLIPEGKQ